ncbi:transporter substrate-binding domain-containing protein [Pseudoalteromonas sp. YIC-656]|uniref:substrate-binding periplasmic protein n=1 Tax=Pseudoalteromonas pernae TaxID=3118054 RepID=UPI003241E5EA
MLVLGVQASPLKYNATASGSYYPYSTGVKENPGISHEFVIKVMAEAGIEIAHVSLPAKRTQQFMLNQQLDFEIVSPTWLTEEERNLQQFVFSDALLPVQELLVTLPDKVSKYASSNSIVGGTVGTVRGYYYHNDHEFIRADFATERELVLALSKKRIEVAIIGDLPALYWSQQLDIDIAFGAMHSKGQLHIRLRSKHKELLPKINDAIATLKSQGIVEQLEDKYLSPIIFKSMPHSD